MARVSRPSCGVAVRAFPPWSAQLLLMSGAAGSSSPRFPGSAHTFHTPE
ncbi:MULTISPECIES: MprA protease, GlyGly-CTERM protein-sorting domain-containing form [Rhodococcus]